MNKKLAGVGVASALIAVIVWTMFLVSFAPHVLNLSGAVGVDLETHSVHSRIRMWKGDQLVFDEYHSGVVTNLGDNATICKMFGDITNYNGTLYDRNSTYISIGNQGSLDQSSTVLPGEWNRTLGSLEDQIQSQLNITCTFYPDSNGPYTADCIGLNFASELATNDLWAYDTFSEVTGIDESFTINVEFQVGVSHS